MKNISCLLLALTLLTPSHAQRYKKLHFKAIVADTHNDFLTMALDKHLAMDEDLSGKTHSDLQRWKKGGVDVEVFSVWCDGLMKNPYAYANIQMDTLAAVVRRNPDKIAIVANVDELIKAVNEKKLSAMFGVEGGHMIENDLNKLDSFYKRGVRYMTLTWNNSTDWATSALDESTRGDSLKHKGLTEFGKQVVKRMNALGMMVDLSHVGEQTFWDAINTSTKPVIVSHSNAYSLCPFRRNLKDDQIKAIAKNGGVIHLNFFSGFLDSTYFKRHDEFNLRHKIERDSMLKINPEPYFSDVFLAAKYPEEAESLRAPMSLLLEHLDYIVKLAGVDHVGLGSDFDGIDSAPQQLDDVTKFPLITKELLKRGYSKSDIMKILGENFVRLFAAQKN